MRLRAPAGMVVGKNRVAGPLPFVGEEAEAAEGEGRTGGGGERESLRRLSPIPLPLPVPLPEVGGVLVATPACTPLTTAGLALAPGTVTTPLAVLGRAVRRLLELLDVLGLPLPLPPAVALAWRCMAPAERGAVEAGGGVFRALLRSKNDSFPPPFPFPFPFPAPFPPLPLGAEGAVAETVTKDEAVDSALSVESLGGRIQIRIGSGSGVRKRRTGTKSSTLGSSRLRTECPT